MILPDENPMTETSAVAESWDLQFQPPDRTSDQLSGLRVLVLGLGSHGGGTDLIRFLISRGAQVSVSDQSSEQELADSLQQLRGLNLCRTTFGGHQREDLTGCDWVVVNPAIPPSSSFLRQVADSDVRAVTEMGLVLSWLPSQHLAAITGTNGKSTTCVLASQMVKESGIPVTAGGNLGGSLLQELDRPEKERRFVVEISSFQAQRLEQGGSRPRIVSITNLSPDHLDWHSDQQQYQNAKSRLLEPYRQDGAVAILPTTGPFGRDYCCPHREIIRCGNDGESQPGDGVLQVQSPAGEISIPYRPTAALGGTAGLENALHAATVAAHLGATVEGIAQAIETFEGLPHRYQNLGELNGIRFINDSKATSPESAAAALERIDTPVHWLCGGKSKGSDLTALVNLASKRSLQAYCFGSVREKLGDALLQGGLTDGHLQRHKTLELAFNSAVEGARPGVAVLLSPAFASFDQYSSFEKRGEHFQQLVAKRSGSHQQDCHGDETGP